MGYFRIAKQVYDSLPPNRRHAVFFQARDMVAAMAIAFCIQRHRGEVLPTNFTVATVYIAYLMCMTTYLVLKLLYVGWKFSKRSRAPKRCVGCGTTEVDLGGRCPSCGATRWLEKVNGK